MNLDALLTLAPDLGAVTAPPDLPAALQAALALLPGHGRLTVAINDPQRHTDSPALLAALVGSRRPADLRLLVATGTHRFGPEARAMFEAPLRRVLPEAPIAWHDAVGKDLIPLGHSPTWAAHPWLLDAEAVLALGSVEPHYFAGFTGAHKTCTIGLAAYPDIEANHALALSPHSGPARAEGNPVFDGIAAMLRGLEASRPTAGVNVIQVGDRIVHASGGTVLGALRDCTALTERMFLRRIPRPADALIAEVAGPLARTFYQADKGIKNNEAAVRDGGTLILVAPCEGGIGQDHFVSLLRECPTYESAVRRVTERGYRLGDHKAVRLRRLFDPAARGVRGFLVSKHLSDDDVHTLGMQRVDTVEAALSLAQFSPANPMLLRVLDAGNTCVVPEEAPGIRD